MFVYRIALSKYANSLVASGRAGRWNPNDIEMIYTSSTRLLACLENIVHRGQLGLSQIFSVMTIRIEDNVEQERIKQNDLPEDWKEFNQMPFTQAIGERWISSNRSAILQVPSSIVQEEVNYLINPMQSDFKFVKLIKTDPFVFDKRIKL